MRHIVYGPGAIGGLLGARLHESGADVLLVARGPHYEALRDVGLRLVSPMGTTTVKMPVVDDPRAIDFEPDDVVLLCVKSQDTGGALRSLSELAPPSISVVSMQNGVANEPTALRYFERVYGALVICPSAHLEPGVVEVGIGPIGALFDVGCYPRGVDDRSESLSGVFSTATFASRTVPDVMRWKYGKLVRNLGNAVDALCGAGARGGELERRAGEEADACLAAAGIAVASGEELAERMAVLAEQPGLVSITGAGGGPQPGGTSAWQSLARGTGSIESDYLNGEIVALGRLHGIPTPVNELLGMMTNRAAQEHWPPASMSPDDLVRLVSADGEHRAQHVPGAVRDPEGRT